MSSNNEYAIQVQDVSKIYKLYDKPIDRLKESLSLTHKNYHRDFFALSDISFNVKKGETGGIIGTNGSGKSTILKSIARQLSLIAGTVRLDGEDMKSLTGAELSKKMAVVMTQRLRGELMTCEDVVATGRYPYTGRFGVLRAEDHAAVQNAMELVQVAEIGDSLFDRISDGQRQRVMLARAICQEPEILILDEPTSYLDVRHKLEFLSILQKLCRERELTVILSLHELELAEKISDRILCVNGRAVDRIGTPEEVMTAGYITELYGIRMGSYDEGSSDMELAAPEGTPQVFVIAGAGSGRKIYRRLQRAGIPFVTGILHENDLDYPVAKALAAEVIAEHPFEPVAQEKIQVAKKQLEKCNRVICCRETFGSLESYHRTAGEADRKVRKPGATARVLENRETKFPGCRWNLWDGENDGKSYYDTGHHVRCREKSPGGGPMPDLPAGRLSGRPF